MPGRRAGAGLRRGRATAGATAAGAAAAGQRPAEGRARRTRAGAAQRYGNTGDRPGYGGGKGGRRAAAPRGRPGQRKGSWWRHWTWKKALGVALAACGGVIVVVAILIVIAYADTAIPTDVSALALQQSSTVYFSNGKSAVGTFGTTNRQVLTSSQIPVQLKNAVIAAEDRSFYSEGGVSPTGILRAAWDDITGSGDALQGGSTITQQFVRNYYAGIGTRRRSAASSRKSSSRSSSPGRSPRTGSSPST